MRYRCSAAYVKVRPSYATVSIDPRWSTFEGFRDHQPSGRPYELGLVLARFGDTGDYSPENCRWATKSENGREANERKMLRLPDGRFARDVARANGITISAFNSRVRLGWDLVDATTRPLRADRRRH